jgi:hypothetical protein
MWQSSLPVVAPGFSTGGGISASGAVSCSSLTANGTVSASSINIGEKARIIATAAGCQIQTLTSFIDANGDPETMWTTQVSFH